MTAEPVVRIDSRSVVARTPDGTELFVLSGQQAQVVRLIAHGLSNREIGERLWLSEDTIKTHVLRLMRRMGAKSRAHAVHIAHLAGLFAADSPSPEVMAHNVSALSRSYHDRHRADCALFRIRYCDCADRSPRTTVQEGHSR